MRISYIVFCYSTLFILGFIDNSRGPLYPEFLNYFQVNPGKGSLIFSLASFMGFIATISSKWWLGLLGAINSTRVALVIHSVACLIMGLAPADNFYLFLFAAVLFGTGVGIETICLNLILAVSTDKTKRRRVLSGLHAMYGIASFAAPFFISLLKTRSENFQDIFLYVSVFPILILITTFRLKPLNISKESSDPFSLPLKHMLTLGVMMGFYVSSEIVLSSRLVFYIESLDIMDKVMSKNMLTLFFLGLLSGRVLFTFKHFDIDNRKLLIMSIAASLLVTLVGISFYPPLLVLNGFTLSYFFPTALDMLGEHFHEHLDIIMSRVFIGVGALLFIVHWGFGLLTETFGISISIWLIPVFMTIVLYLLQFRLKFLQEYR